MTIKVKEKIYVELDFKIYPLEPYREILIYELSKNGFDAFLETDFGVTTYTFSDQLDESLLRNILTSLEESDCQISYRKQPVTIKNWNQEQEKTLAPVVIRHQCLICRADFETDLEYHYKILIQPNLSFGTGHHPTTYLMLDNLLNYSLTERKVIDVGCGTGILSILSEKMGAARVDAIEIDAFAYENAQYNMELNESKKIHLHLGTLPTLNFSDTVDIILVNITKNVILEELALYFELLSDRSHILLSGFLEMDLKEIVEFGKKIGFKKLHTETKDGWGFIAFFKL